MASANQDTADIGSFFSGARTLPGLGEQEAAGPGTAAAAAAAAAAAEQPGDPAQPDPPGPSGRRRRQWGSDRRTRAMPVVPPPVSDRRVAMGRLAVIVTVLAWFGYLVTWFAGDFFGSETLVARAEAVLYLFIVTLLTVSALANLLSRLGFFYRTRTHHRASRAVLNHFFDTTTPTLTTIIPSYQEDERVIRNTLLSAALQEYPDKRVVLLIDDPFVPKTTQAREQLEAARALPDEIGRLLAGPAARFAGALDAFEQAAERGEPLSIGSMTVLASHYHEAVARLEDLAAAQEIIDHTDSFFANEVVLRLAGSLGEIRQALLDSAGEGVVLEQQMFRRLYRRLVWTFRADITSFERKRYVSLSHEPNKAMNLNSYLGLMGGSYREVATVTGTALVRSTPASGDLDIPDPDYVVTLDADSVLLPEYCLRLVHLLEQGEYRDLAIAQTPYSAFPGSATRVERIAGATTDLKYMVHQGLTYYDATFWVGANAVIRKRALDAIGETLYLGDWEIRRYIRDRTVIEDTESTIDMGIHGWGLFNVPERMSYSATPPDFGSLCIQRRRWANGGLLILPKLRRQSRARRTAGQRTRFAELFLRCNYMGSICWSSLSLLVLVAFPFNTSLISPLLAFVALPYFLAMASDLRYCGYKRLDVLRIYGFNLVLLPVNLAGTLSSIMQAITASKAPFARTPKVRDRTVVPPFFVVAPYLVIALAGFTFYFAYRYGRVGNMAYAALNVVLACYALKAFIGLRNSMVDAWIHTTSLLYRPPGNSRRVRRAARAEQQVPEQADWRSVLEVGNSVPAQMKAPLAGEPAEGAPRRLSVLRIAVALVLVAGAGYGGLNAVRTRLTAGAGVIHPTWFAPYVDVTLTPTYPFQSSAADAARQTVLGFVVADPSSGCMPSWGAAYTLSQADQSLALGSRIAQVQQDGAQPIVSFGGRASTSLDVACTSVTSLIEAYQSVIDSYQLTAMDLDIEGAALDDFEAGQRRAAAVAGLERAAAAAHRPLSVWLTLPVGPSGLQYDALAVIESMLRDRVSIAGINVMTMDFTPPPAAGTTILQLAENALYATHAQLARLFPRYGIHLSAQQIWQQLGATVMIGQNDVQAENFTVPDAQGLASFAAWIHLGRISMWSLNRDSACGASFPENGLLSPGCSGTAESSLEFSRVFGQLRGDASITPAVQPAVADTNPADAPYPQWSADAGYPSGYKVVEDGEIYQARWYSTGEDPQAQYPSQTPWQLLGPVLPGEHAPVIVKPAGTHPNWSVSTRYQAGSEVLYQGLPYQAKWNNQGVSPLTQGTDSSGSPWKALYRIPGEPTGLARPDCVTNAPYDATIAPSASVTIGFTSTGSDAPPGAFQLNGTNCKT